MMVFHGDMIARIHGNAQNHITNVIMGGTPLSPLSTPKYMTRYMNPIRIKDHPTNASGLAKKAPVGKTKVEAHGR